PAALGTLLFALLPYHAESVAWIAGRKDVLSLLLALLSWHAHLSAGGGGPPRRIGFTALSALLLGAALLAKSAALTVVPMIWVADVLLRGDRPWRSLLPLLPHGLLAAAGAVIVALLWSGSDLIREPPVPGTLGRIGLVGWTAWHYLSTVAWPFALSPLYAVPGPERLVAGAVATGALLLVLAALAFAARRRSRHLHAGPVVAGAWFAFGIAPFINIVPLYYLVADRYLLFPSLGVALAVALAARSILLFRHPGRRALAGGAMLLVALSFGVVRTDECRAHRDSRTLWEHAVEREPEAFFARLKLAETLRVAGESERAALQYREARRIDPGSRLALMGLLFAELLVDATNLPEAEANDLLLRFGAAADDDRALLRLEARLRQLGCARAAAVVRERLAERRSR
ncbi:MAG TPA: hypothetical protein VM285_04490, partial [Polyangia bacterium]|nr:hypothetical protein [Polyangia bacterium]